MKTLGDSHLLERGKLLKKTIIFLLTKQFVQKNKCNLCKKTIFLYRIAVALRMECVDLSCLLGIDDNSIIVALRMECVDLSNQLYEKAHAKCVALRMECVDLSYKQKNSLCFC